MNCKHYLPWTVVCSLGCGQQEIDDACVNNEKRTIKQCEHTRNPEACPEFQKDEYKENPILRRTPKK